jgi:hypothetical protein
MKADSALQAFSGQQPRRRAVCVFSDFPEAYKGKPVTQSAFQSRAKIPRKIFLTA